MITISLNNKSIIKCNLLDDLFYNQILKESNILKNTINKGINTIYSFDILTEDIFNLLYKVVISFNENKDISPSILINKPILIYLYNSSDLSKLRLRTSGSIVNASLSLKYILDEVLLKLRGSSISNTIKKEQNSLKNLLNEKKSIKDKLNDIFKNKIKDFPFDENIKDLLNNILNMSSFKNDLNNLDALSLLEKIISVSKNLLSHDNKNSNKFNSFNKNICNTLNDLIKSDLEENYSNDEFLDSFLSKLKSTIEENKKNNEFDELNDDNVDDINKNIKGIKHKSDKSIKKMIDNISKEIENHKKRNLYLIKSNSMNNGSLKNESSLFDCDFDNYIIINDNNMSGNNYIEVIDLNSDGNLNQSNLKNYSKVKNKHLDIEDIKSLLKRLNNVIIDINTISNSIKSQIKKLKIDKIANESIEKINTFNKDINTLNINKNSLNSLKFDEIIKLSKYINNPDMKIFINKIGKKREIIRKVYSKKKKSNSIVTQKILYSNDLDNIVDDEFINISMDIEKFENEFYDKYLNNRLLTYEKIDSKEKNKGPIILCYDGSGSMEGDKIKETKANIISLIEVAKLQKRKMITIQFASNSEPLYIKEINPNKVEVHDIFQIMDEFLCGGTNFEKPLKKAITYIKSDKYTHADILFITDGICSISENFKKEFVNTKVLMKFKLYSIIMYGNTYSDYGDLEDISDEIIEIKRIDKNNLNEEIANRIFSI